MKAAGAVLATAALAAAAAGAAEPPAATLLAARSEIAFVSRQMGVPVEGRFGRFAAQVAIDPTAPDGGRVALAVDTASAGFGVAEIDAELPKPVWFDSAKFPQASFRSSRVRALGGGRFEIDGTLLLKGTARELRVPVALARDGNVTVATGSFAVRRLQFGIGSGEWADTALLADEVQVRFRLAFDGLPP